MYYLQVMHSSLHIMPLSKEFSRWREKRGENKIYHLINPRDPNSILKCFQFPNLYLDSKLNIKKRALKRSNK